MFNNVGLGIGSSETQGLWVAGGGTSVTNTLANSVDGNFFFFFFCIF